MIRGRCRRTVISLILTLVASVGTVAVTHGVAAAQVTGPAPVWVTWQSPGDPYFEYGLGGVSCPAADSCVAVGAMRGGTTGSTVPAVEQWNGVSWRWVPTTPPGIHLLGDSLTAVSCPSTAFCMAAGSYFSRWNGSIWSSLPDVPAGGLKAISCTSATFCVAVGQQYVNCPSCFTQTLIEQWNGSTWSVVSSPNQGSGLANTLNGVACSMPMRCQAVGTFSNGSLNQTLAEEWNGLAWIIVPSPDTPPNVSQGLNSLSCAASTACMAVGSSANGPAQQTLVEQWNGISWSIVASPNTASDQDNVLNGVSCSSMVSCHATGTSRPSNGTAPLFEVWDGASWSIQPSLQAAIAGTAISCSSANQCAAVGGVQVIDMLYTPGYWEVGSDGGIFSFGSAHFYGSMGGQHLNEPIVGAAALPDGKGYWEVASDGGIFAFGNAKFYGSTGGVVLNKPIVGMAVTPDGNGYWLVASDGGIFAFGDAKYFGSMGGVRLNKPVVGMAPSSDGQGYVLAASDGGIFAFGDAQYFGSMVGDQLNKPVVGMMPGSGGQGYTLVASDGGIFTFGGAPFAGSMGGQPLNEPIVGLVSTADPNGYWEVAADGGVFSFGSAVFEGSTGGQPLNEPIVGGIASGALG
jgi:hypothetical protein